MVASPGRNLSARHCDRKPSFFAGDDAECGDTHHFTLTDRIYEFNAKATGYDDGRLLAGCIRNDAGDIIAGFNGHTWGGNCELSNVWVDERYRGQGLGALLLRSAEREAVARDYTQIVLATHSFQAQGFYERMGYQRKYAIEGQPKGYADIVYVKLLRASPVDDQSTRRLGTLIGRNISSLPAVSIHT